MEQGAQKMIENLHKNTGKKLEEWIEVVKAQNISKHGEIIKFLKIEHGFTHGFANLVAHKTKKSDAGSVEKKEDLITDQYKGKEHFKPLYDQLLSSIQSFGNEVELAPKKAYVSLRRKKQFATLKPATKSRFEIGINLKGQEPTGKLEAEKPNAMCSHRINVSGIEDIDKEVIEWLRAAYENAG